MRVAIMALLASGCWFPPDPERTEDFVGLGPIELDITLGSHTFGIEVLHRAGPEPCPVLGDDFRGDIGGAALSTYPGGIVEHCNAPTTSQPCLPAPSTCEMPWLGGGDVPIPVAGLLTIEDASRIVHCELGDAFVPRTMTRVPATSWDVTPGEAVTVRWSPATDLARLDLSIVLRDGAIPAPEIPHTIDGDLITFEVPRTLDAGPHTFVVMARGEVPMRIKGCGEVPNRRFYTYWVEQTLATRR